MPTDPSQPTNASQTTLTMTAPDDWHIHLRDGSLLEYTVKHAAENFERAIIMPNLVPPVTNAEQALAYKERILSEVPASESFEPLMVVYLTDKTTAEDIRKAKEAGVVACKLYPAGATTNSDAGVTSIEKIYPTLEAMQAHGLLLLVHGEITADSIDIFDREAVFIEQILTPVVAKFPELKIVLEHITTSDAVDFVGAAGENVGATITAHHLLFNRNHMLVGGIKPHYYCLPVLKRNTHQQALIKAATSDCKRFFLGTDSAPHAANKKESSCGCAGSYTAFAALALYAEAFEQANALDKLEQFASFNGPDFYGMAHNSKQITLIKSPWSVPDNYAFGDDKLVPIMAGKTLQWRVK